MIGGVFQDDRDVVSGVKYRKAKEITRGENESNLNIVNEINFIQDSKKRCRCTTQKHGIVSYFSTKREYLILDFLLQFFTAKMPERDVIIQCSIRYICIVLLRKNAIISIILTKM